MTDAQLVEHLHARGYRIEITDVPMIREACDALGKAARSQALEEAAQLVEQMTLRKRTMRAAGDAKPVAPCEIADAIRRLGEEAGRGA